MKGTPTDSVGKFHLKTATRVSPLMLMFPMLEPDQSKLTIISQDAIIN